MRSVMRRKRKANQLRRNGCCLALERIFAVCGQGCLIAPRHSATVLGVSVDALLGTAPPKRMKALATNRPERRLMEIEKLDAAD